MAKATRKKRPRDNRARLRRSVQLMDDGVITPALQNDVVVVGWLGRVAGGDGVCAKKAREILGRWSSQ